MTIRDFSNQQAHDSGQVIEYFAYCVSSFSIHFMFFVLRLLYTVVASIAKGFVFFQYGNCVYIH